MIAGNKVDLADKEREVFVEDVQDWVDQEFKQNRIIVIECSAFNTFNIMEVFKSFLHLARIDLEAFVSSEK